MIDEEGFRANHFRKAVLSLPVKDCTEAVRYYCEILGFEKDFDDAILDVEKTLFAGVSRGECELTLNQHDQQEYHATVGCEVDDVDRLYEEYSAREVSIIIMPRDEPWGERHMAITDLYGNEIHFSKK